MHKKIITLVCAISAAIGGTAALGGLEARQAGPRFQVDPSWPQEMPNNWILGAITGVFVDAKDHVWVTHLPETLTEEELVRGAEAADGHLLQGGAVGHRVRSAGQGGAGLGRRLAGRSRLWPRNPHGIFVDHNDFVWVGTHMHHRVMKFTRDGKLVMTIGEYDKNAGSNDTTLLGGPAGIWVDPKTNEAFIADGYRNRRVIVFDGATGKYLRHWGAYGEPPDDTQKFDPKTMPNGAPQQAVLDACTASPARSDGKIYVADRRGNRIQVFDQQRQVHHARRSSRRRTLRRARRSCSCCRRIAQQQWLYLADGTNHKVWILRRSDLEIVGEFGRGGRQVGQMLRPHGMSVDSKGNLYVGEASTGRRVQKFTLISK